MVRLLLITSLVSSVLANSLFAQQTPVRISNIDDGGFSYGLQSITVYDGRLYFRAYAPATGFEYYMSDGNTVSLLADMCPGSGSGAVLTRGKLPVAAGSLYLCASPVDNGPSYLYKVTGNSQPVQVLVNGTRILAAGGIAVLNGDLYFFGRLENSTQGGFHRYSPAGNTLTFIPTDFGSSGTVFPTPSFSILAGDNSLYFFATVDAIPSTGIARYTPSNGLLSYDVIDTAYSDRVLDPVVHQDKAYFLAARPGSRSELFSYEGTAVQQLTNFATPGPPATTGISQELNSIASYLGDIYFNATTATEFGELYKYSPSGNTVSLAAANPDTFGYMPTHLTVLNNQLFFTGFDTVHGSEPRVFDAYSGTASLVADANTNQNINGGDAMPASYALLNGKLFFSAWTDTAGVELHRMDAPAAIANTDAGSAIKVYPNPATDAITIEAAEGSKYEVLSLLGQRLQSGTIDNRRQTISTSALPAGMYVLMLTQKSGACKSVRVVKE